MRVIILFSNYRDYIPRTREGDLILIARDESGALKTKLKYLCTGIDPKGLPILKELESIDEIIGQTEKITVNIVGHSGKGSKQIQSDQTEYYPKQFIPIDDITRWLEKEVLKEATPRATISVLTCEAADGNLAYPAIAEQMFSLFETKPQKVTARKGYVYIEKEIYSLDAFDMLVKKAMQEDTTDSPILERAVRSVLKTYGGIFKLSTDTKIGEKFAYYLGKDKQAYKIDMQLYHLFQLIKTLDPQVINTQIAKIVNKDLENVSVAEFFTLAEYGIKTDPKGKLCRKASLVLQGKINPAEIVSPDLSGYELKNILLGTCQSLKKNIQNYDLIQNRDALNEIIAKTQDFIIYRHPRNYPIGNLLNMIDLLMNIIGNEGRLSPDQITDLTKLSHQISSEEQIKSDASHRSGAVGIRPPSYYKEIHTVTKTKNQAFASEIDEFLQKVNSNLADPNVNPEP